MNRKQKQELKGFYVKKLPLEDVESQSSDIPFGMDINDACMLGIPTHSSGCTTGKTVQMDWLEQYVSMNW